MEENINKVEVAYYAAGRSVAGSVGRNAEASCTFSVDPMQLCMRMVKGWVEEEERKEGDSRRSAVSVKAARLVEK